jgi:hypothetical protein
MIILENPGHLNLWAELSAAAVSGSLQKEVRALLFSMQEIQ